MSKTPRKAPPPTRAISFGQDLPPPDPSIYGKTDPLPPDLHAQLELTAGPNAPATYPIRRPVVVLGRGEGLVDIDVGDDSASRRHAFVAYRDGSFSLHDMGSTNGTYMGGQAISNVVLEDGDEFQIGTAVVRFRIL